MLLKNSVVECWNLIPINLGVDAQFVTGKPQITNISTLQLVLTFPSVFL